MALNLFKKRDNNYVNLTGNYSLNGNNTTTTNNSGLSLYSNPFAKKTTPNLTSTINKQNTVSNPYGFSSEENLKKFTGNTNYDLSPKSLLERVKASGSKVSTSTPISTISSVPKTETPSAFQQYLNSINKISEGQKSRSATNFANTEKYYSNLYDTTNQSLLGQIPEAQQGFENYKAGQQARVAKAQAALPGQEENVNTDYGAAQKVRAQTRNESEARLKNQFAGMNATDSYGAGSLTAELSGLENTFNAETASADVKRLDQIFKLRQNVKDVETEADSLVTQEELNLRSTIRSIQSQVGLNNIEKENQIRQAYQTSQDKVDEIDAYIAQLRYQQAGTSATGSSNQNKVATMVQNLLNADTKPITGFNRIVIPGTVAATTKADFEGLKNLLALAKRGELKGSGSVSDFEAKMLEKAAMAGLDPTMDDATFRSRLQQLANDLASEGAVSSTKVNMLAPDGNTYAVDQSEVQQAQANGWRRA